MLLSAVSVLVVAQSSSEIPEGLMNNPVLCHIYSGVFMKYCMNRINPVGTCIPLAIVSTNFAVCDSVYVFHVTLKKKKKQTRWDWTARGSNLSRSNSSRTSPDRPWGLSILTYNGYGSLAGLERTRRGMDHSPHLATKYNRK